MLKHMKGRRTMLQALDNHLLYHHCVNDLITHAMHMSVVGYKCAVILQPPFKHQLLTCTGYAAAAGVAITIEGMQATEALAELASEHALSVCSFQGTCAVPVGAAYHLRHLQGWHRQSNPGFLVWTLMHVLPSNVAAVES